MKHDQHMADEQERQMLEHFRRHSSGEPSAQLDAQILAAASAVVGSTTAVETRPSLGARLHRWLFGAGGRQRWSVALTGVACLGIGVSLTWRSVEQAPDAFDAVPSGASMAPQSAPVPTPQAESAARADEPQRSRTMQSAPQIQGSSADATSAEKKLSAGVSNQLLREASSADALHEQLPQAARAPTEQALSKAAEPTGNQAQQQLHSELQRLLKLRRDGWTEEADALLLQLMREYPELDVDAQLQQLQQVD